MKIGSIVKICTELFVCRRLFAVNLCTRSLQGNNKPREYLSQIRKHLYPLGTFRSIYTSLSCINYRFLFGFVCENTATLNDYQDTKCLLRLCSRAVYSIFCSIFYLKNYLKRMNFILIYFLS